MKKRAMPLLMSVLMLGGTQAMAGTVHYTVSVPQTDLAFSPPTMSQQAVTLPKFDPSLGTLKSVQVTLSSTLTYNSTVANFLMPQDVTLQYGVDCGLSRPDGTLLVQGNLSALEQAFLQMFEVRLFSGSTVGSQTGVFSAPADLALFAGAGDVALTLGALGQHTLAPFPSDIMDATTMQYSAQVDVTYEYDVVSVIALAVDVKPGSDSNPLNLKSHGLLPVAVLTTGSCNALDLNVATLRLGDASLSGVASPVKAAAEDVNGDGLLDLVLHFSADELIANGAINASSTSVTLSGALQNGTQAVGTDTVSIVAGSNKGN